MAESDDKEIIRGLYWNCASNAFNSVFAILTVFGSVFLLFMKELGVPKQLMGTILSLFPFCGLIAPFLSSYIEYFGSKRLFLICFGLRKIVIASLLSLPWIISRYGNRAGLNYLVVSIAVFALLRAIAEAGYYAWTKEFIPDRLRGKYTALNTILSNITGLVAVFFARHVLGRGGGIEKYIFLMGTGCIFGIFGVYFMSFVPGGKPFKSDEIPKIISPRIIEPLKDKNFLRFVSAVGMSLFGASLMVFLPLFAREKLGFSPGNVILLDNATIVSTMVMGILWGYLGDRFGGRPVVIISLCIYTLVPFGWLILTRTHPSVFIFSMLLYGISGATLLGRAVGDTRFLYAGILKDVNVVYYTSLFYAWIGLIEGCAKIAGGYILKIDFTTMVAGRIVDSYSAIFIINFLCQLAAIFIYRKVRPDKQVRTRAFLIMMARRLFNW